jgi:hypothetical protein
MLAGPKNIEGSATGRVVHIAFVKQYDGDNELGCARGGTLFSISHGPASPQDTFLTRPRPILTAATQRRQALAATIPTTNVDTAPTTAAATNGQLPTPNSAHVE